MSEGPIKREREATTAPRISLAKRDVVHAASLTPSLTYCGRRRTSALRVDYAGWGDVTCADCRAARRADEAAGV